MADQSARQRARRVALDAQARMRARRVERERRRDALGLAVVTALAERDALVAACEARAGVALVTLTGREGLSLAGAVEWCGGADVLSVREAARLRALGLAAEDEHATTNGNSARPSGAGTTSAGEPASSSGDRTTGADGTVSSADGGPMMSSEPADADSSGGASSASGSGLAATMPAAVSAASGAGRGAAG